MSKQAKIKFSDGGQFAALVEGIAQGDAFDTATLSRTTAQAVSDMLDPVLEDFDRNYFPGDGDFIESVLKIKGEWQPKLGLTSTATYTYHMTVRYSTTPRIAWEGE